MHLHPPSAPYHLQAMVSTPDVVDTLLPARTTPACHWQKLMQDEEAKELVELLVVNGCLPAGYQDNPQVLFHNLLCNSTAVRPVAPASGIQDSLPAGTDAAQPSQQQQQQQLVPYQEAAVVDVQQLEQALQEARAQLATAQEQLAASDARAEEAEAEAAALASAAAVEHDALRAQLAATLEQLEATKAEADARTSAAAQQLESCRSELTAQLADAQEQLAASITARAEADARASVATVQLERRVTELTAQLADAQEQLAARTASAAKAEADADTRASAAWEEHECDMRALQGELAAALALKEAGEREATAHREDASRRAAREKAELEAAKLALTAELEVVETELADAQSKLWDKAWKVDVGTAAELARLRRELQRGAPNPEVGGATSPRRSSTVPSQHSLRYSSSSSMPTPARRASLESAASATSSTSDTDSAASFCLSPTLSALCTTSLAASHRSHMRNNSAFGGSSSSIPGTSAAAAMQPSTTWAESSGPSEAPQAGSSHSSGSSTHSSYGGCPLPRPTQASTHSSPIKRSLAGPEHSSDSISSIGSARSDGSAASFTFAPALRRVDLSRHATSDDVAAEDRPRAPAGSSRGGGGHAAGLSAGWPSSPKLAVQPRTPPRSDEQLDSRKYKAGFGTAPGSLDAAIGTAQPSLEAGSAASPVVKPSGCGVAKSVCRFLGRKKPHAQQEEEQPMEGVPGASAAAALPSRQQGGEEQGCGGLLVLPKVAVTSLERPSFSLDDLKCWRPKAPADDATPADSEPKQAAVEAAAPAPEASAAAAAATAAPGQDTTGADVSQRRQQSRRGFRWLPWSKKGHRTAAAGADVRDS
jgi:hypothetical protein